MVRPTALLAVLFSTPLVVADEPALKPDPLAKTIEWPEVLPAAFDVMPAIHAGAILADHVGPFAAIATSTEGTAKAVIDLRTGKKVGEWKTDLLVTNTQALGPDGKLFVGVAYAVRPAPGVQPKIKMLGFDTAAGKKIWEVDLASFPSGLRFAGADRVVFTRGTNGRPELYDARTGKLLRSFATDYPQAGATSPGGAYLAVIDKGAVVVLATADGNQVWRTELPKAPGGAVLHCRELNFSPDGSRLAGVFAGDRTSARVLGWDLVARRQEADARVPHEITGYGDVFRWAADSSAWLLPGGAMADPDTGAVLWQVPRGQGGTATYLPVAAHRVIRIETGNPREWVQAVSLPKEQVEASIQAVRAGGGVADGWLPALARADRSAAKAVTIPARADDWAYRPDPVRPAAPRQPLRLPLPADRIESAHVTEAAGVFELIEKTAFFNDLLRPRQLIRVDLTTGKPTGRVEVPHVCRLADVSADAAVAVTVDHDARRLDVWDLGTGKHLAGWRPAEVRNPLGGLNFVSALSADWVLTLTQGGELAVWSVPEVRAIYTAAIPGLSNPARSWGRKYLFGLQGETVRVIETATGDLAGDLPTGLTAPGYPLNSASPILPPTPPTLAVRADGGELVALFRARPASGFQAVRWDLKTAKLKDRFPLPWASHFPVPDVVRYAGPDHLLIHATDLFGLTSRVVEWKYTVAVPWTSKFAGPAPDGRTWYVVGAPVPWHTGAVGSGLVGAAPTAVLVAAELPDAEASRRIKAMTEGPGALVKPGAKMAVKLELTGSGAEATGPKVLDELKRVWKPRGLTVVEDGADLTVKLTVAQKETDRVLDVFPPFRPGDPGAGRRGVKVIELQCGVAVVTAGGKTVWEAPAETLQMRSPFEMGVQRVVPEEAEKTLHRRTWEQVPGWAARAALPRFLAVDEDGNAVTLPGRSQLTAGGVVPPPANE